MVFRHGPCDTNRLRAFLDTPFAEDGGPCDLAEHLEHCEKCRGELEAMAGGRWWKEVRPFVRPAAGEEPGIRTQVAAKAPTEDPDLAFLSPPDQPGHLGRFGPYQILDVLGKGGMGVVLKARDPALNRIVAIKVLSPMLATNGAARERFKREARAAAAVVHQHVVAIHHIDTDEASKLPYLVMPCVVGRSLQERIDHNGPLDLPSVLRIAMQAATGLAAAHAQGIAHRDVKPANILLENGVERVVLTDFGLARAVDDASLTQSGVIPGTPQYMSPEQARGETTDSRSDLFSLGSVLYAMCTGHAPFRASSALAVLRRVTDEHARPVREVNPAVPENLAAVIEKLHAKDPADRFQTAGEVAAVLGQMLADLQKPGRRVTAAAPPPARRAGAMPRRKRWHPALVAAFIVVLFVGMFAAVSSKSRHRDFIPAEPVVWENKLNKDPDGEAEAAAECAREAQDNVREAEEEFRKARENLWEAIQRAREAGQEAEQRAREEAEETLRAAEQNLGEARRSAHKAMDKAHQVAREVAARSRELHAIPPVPPGVPVPPVVPVPPGAPALPIKIDVPFGPLVMLDTPDGASFRVVFGDPGDTIVGSGKPATKTYDLKDFNAVEIRSPFSLDLKQGKEFKVALTVDDNLFEHVLVEKDGKKLVIGLKGKNKSFHLNRDNALKADVTMPELESLSLNGASRATAEGFKAEKPVRLNLNGASQFTGSLQGGELTIDANGASTLKLAGSGKNLRLKLNGASQLRMADFTASGDRLIIDANGASQVALKGQVTAGVIKAIEASHLNLGDAKLAAADVTLKGASHGTVRVTEKLNYEVEGASHLNYYGDPVVGKASKQGFSHVSHIK